MWTKDKKDETNAPDLSGLNQAASEVASGLRAQVAAADLKPIGKLSAPPEMLTPAAQAYTSQMLKDAIAGVFEQLGPVLKDMALTPQKIAEMEAIRRAPPEEQANLIARNAREKKLMIAEQEENRKNLQLVQDNCLHR